MKRMYAVGFLWMGNGNACSSLMSCLVHSEDEARGVGVRIAEEKGWTNPVITILCMSDSMIEKAYKELKKEKCVEIPSTKTDASS